MSKLDKLKEIQKQKKALLDEQRALREELDQGKEERKTARKAQAKARKEVQGHKSALREQTASVYKMFSEGDAEALNKLADSIMESSTALAGAVREFADAAEQLEEL